MISWWRDRLIGADTLVGTAVEGGREWLGRQRRVWPNYVRDTVLGQVQTLSIRHFARVTHKHRSTHGGFARRHRYTWRQRENEFIRSLGNRLKLQCISHASSHRFSDNRFDMNVIVNKYIKTFRVCRVCLSSSSAASIWPSFSTHLCKCKLLFYACVSCGRSSVHGLAATMPIARVGTRDCALMQSTVCTVSIFNRFSVSRDQRKANKTKEAPVHWVVRCESRSQWSHTHTHIVIALLCLSHHRVLHSCICLTKCDGSWLHTLYDSYTFIQVFLSLSVKNALFFFFLFISVLGFARCARHKHTDDRFCSCITAKNSWPKLPTTMAHHAYTHSRRASYKMASRPASDVNGLQHARLRAEYYRKFSHAREFIISCCVRVRARDRAGHSPLFSRRTMVRSHPGYPSVRADPSVANDCAVPTKTDLIENCR